CIVIMNAILGFVQEYRAERSLEALKGLAPPKAHGLREGGIVAVPSRELVPGDVAVLSAGDRVPADARLLEVASLRVNEASLTGESLPVSKAVEPLPRDSFLGDRKNMVFMGTTVDGGRGKAGGTPRDRDDQPRIGPPANDPARGLDSETSRGRGLGRRLRDLLGQDRDPHERGNERPRGDCGHPGI